MFAADRHRRNAPPNMNRKSPAHKRSADADSGDVPGEAAAGQRAVAATRRRVRLAKAALKRAKKALQRV